MKIERLSLMNFRPFYGEHIIDLSTGSTSNLIVIFGENMYGKTALLNSLRWESVKLSIIQLSRNLSCSFQAISVFRFLELFLFTKLSFALVAARVFY